MYQPFERFGDTSEQEGFGLGLPITLGLVNMLGGTIDVKSDIGKGCILPSDCHYLFALMRFFCNNLLLR